MEQNKQVQDAAENGSTQNEKETYVITKVVSHSKKIIYITVLAGFGLFFNSCFTGYVASQPTSIEIIRPSRPSELHIWIDGDWSYNQRSHTYVQRNGYWAKPHRGRTYVSGHWQNNARGHSWVPGHWQGHSRMMNHTR